MKPRAGDGVILLMAILAIIGAFLYGDGRWLHWLAKPATTLLIAAIAWRVRDPAQPTYRRAVLAGMLLSCVGDIALMLPMDAFVPGLVAFLLAHVCYIVAFRDGLRAGRGLLRQRPAGGLAVLNVLGLWPHLPVPMRVPVLAYVVVLASMAALALARQWRSRSPVPWKRSARWAAAGALLFVASDSLLAWDRFAGGLPLASLLVLSTYYGAQYAIARSVKQQRGRRGLSRNPHQGTYDLIPSVPFLCGLLVVHAAQGALRIELQAHGFAVTGHFVQRPPACRPCARSHTRGRLRMRGSAGHCVVPAMPAPRAARPRNRCWPGMCCCAAG